MSLQNTSQGSEPCPGLDLILEKQMWICEEPEALGDFYQPTSGKFPAYPGSASNLWI